MVEMSKNAAYLVKNGIPYETVVAMSPAEIKKNVRAMQKAGGGRPPAA